MADLPYSVLFAAMGKVDKSWDRLLARFLQKRCLGGQEFVGRKI